MKTLRGRLFAAVLAAIVLTVALTVAIGAALTRRTADHNTRVSLARRADLLAAEEQQQPSYIAENYLADNVRVIVQRRAAMGKYVNPSRSANGSLKLKGTTYIYSYRPIGPRGLLLLEPRTRPAGWGSFLRDLLVAGGVGAVLAALISFVLAGSVVRPIRRVSDASRALAEGGSPEPLPLGGTAELAALAQSFNEMSTQLDASREAERNFLLSVSHELKTPLTAIRGYAEGLGEGAFDPRVAADTILVETRRLERLVHDLLDLARMNRRSFQVRSEPVDLGALAREVVARHDATARNFGVALHAEAGDAWVTADHDRVLQVASNLVENALRATPRGGSVVVRALGDTLVVSDTGLGLADDDVARAFDRFFLYDKYGKERPVGSGLGLAIVKQLVTAMEGDVDVGSRAGNGATFTVRLPSVELRRVDDLEVAARHPAETV
ncbi:MAG: HAMP domain-containing histidine kinase [Actinobacteria bacterium]|nr:HAMP domain-containing histidine kinase [Actinomycetota bacterium]